MSARWRARHLPRRPVERDATGDWFVGINAATFALLTGENDKAKELAKAVADDCAKNHKHKKMDRFGLLATEGEAALILEESEDRTIHFYREALNELSPGQMGHGRKFLQTSVSVVETAWLSS